MRAAFALLLVGIIVVGGTTALAILFYNLVVLIRNYFFI